MAFAPWKKNYDKPRQCIKKESEKVGLKLNIQKTKIMALHGK